MSETGAAQCYAFEPGIARREGSGSRFSENVSGTIRANMGDNQTAVCVGNGQLNQISMRE